ncbi:MAG: insulinase family protein [Fibrobacteria bacterium]|nr:insulinase family protein [Fibrobacteria bacterium]
MKKLIFFPITLILIISCTGTGVDLSDNSAMNQENAIAPHYRSLNYPEFNYIPPHPQEVRVLLDSGITAYLVKDTSLSLTETHFYFPNDYVPQSPVQAAALSLYSDLLISGGTKELSPEQIEDSLEFIAAHSFAHLGEHTANMGFNTLSKDTWPMLQLLKASVLEPRFDRDIFALQKKKMLENIKHRYDTPRHIGNLVYEYIMYGHHPSNWLITEKEAEKVKGKDLKSHTGFGFFPERVVIAVSGDFQKKPMIDSLKNILREFRTLKPASDIPEVPFRGPEKPGIYLFDKEFSQVTIKAGFPGLKRPHPDYYPLAVASYILGSGGFASRLVTSVRSEAGLAYVVRSFVESDYYRKGTVGFYLQTKAESGTQAIKLSLDEIRKMADSGVTQEELQAAKSALVQSLPSLFKTSQATAEIFAQSEVWKRDLDHFVKYPQIINALTIEEVNRVFKKYFVADSARIAIVGPKDKINGNTSEDAPKITSFGPVTEITAEELEKKD